MAVNKLKSEGVKRFLKDEREIVSDTWKLKPAKFIKRNDRSPADRPIWEEKEHTHNFRTYDSNGRQVNKSCSIGGHYHEVRTFEKDGELYAECGPAIYNKASRENNKNGRFPQDNHTHELEFKGSDLIKLRKHVSAAQEYMQAYANYAKQNRVESNQE